MCIQGYVSRCVTFVPQVLQVCVRCVFRCVTFVAQVLQVYVQQDAAVAAAHDQQGEHVERGEVEHVENCFLPAAAEAAVSRTLSEVSALYLHGPEDEELQEEKVRVRPELR